MNPRLLGPRLGGKVQEVIRAVKAGDWTRDGNIVTAAGTELRPGESELRLAASDPGSTTALPGNAGLIALDTDVTPELAAEGAARDVVRDRAAGPKDAGLAVSDRIRLTVGANGRIADSVRTHAGFVSAETLATDLTVVPEAEVAAEPRPAGDGGTVRVTVAKDDR